MKTLLVIMAIATRISSLDPFSLTGIETYQATGNIVEPLARSHPRTKEFVPWLAESWSVDTKKSTFRVKLRAGVKFHNGQSLTSEDVKFTFEAYRDPRFKGGIWQGMWEDIAGVEVVDPLTAEFRMKRLSYQAFENVLLSLRVLPKSFYGDADINKFHSQMIGTGPFQVARFDRGRALELKPFDGWWGKAAPKFNLLVKTVPDAKLAQEMLMKGELDYFALPAGLARDQVKTDARKFRLVERESSKGEGAYIDLNLREELFQNKTVRQALLILWDRADLNAKLFGGRAKLALDSFSPNVSYYPPGQPEPYDTARAVKMLQEAGWTDSDKDGVLDKRVDGKKRDFAFTIVVNSARTERWISLYQQDARKAGVKVAIKRLEEDTQYWKLLEEGKFQATASEGGLSESVHASAWKTGAPYNFSGFSNKHVDQLLEKLEREFDLKKRHVLERELIAKVRAEFTELPALVTSGEPVLLSRRLELDPEFPNHAWSWRLKD